MENKKLRKKDISSQPVGAPEKYSYTDRWSEWIEEWKLQIISGGELPSLERLTRFLQDKFKAECQRYICINTVRAYGNSENAKPEFLEALEWTALEQRIDLIEKGLKGEYNSTIAKLILSANHGMHEKTESDQNVRVAAIPTITLNGKEVKFDIGT